MRALWSKRGGAGLMSLDAAVAAMGRDAVMRRRDSDVEISQIAGTVARTEDFDERLRLRNRRLRDRQRRILDLVTSGAAAPIDLVQLGELYFVVDGHHRVSAARELGQHTIAARVVCICTVAFAMGCLRPAHLPSKAAERRFLERIPLPWDVRTDLWLPEPADWARLADAPAPHARATSHDAPADYSAIPAPHLVRRGRHRPAGDDPPSRRAGSPSAACPAARTASSVGQSSLIESIFVELIRRVNTKRRSRID